MVQACRDYGAEFDRRCRSLEFQVAVEKARELRAFAPGELRALCTPHPLPREEK
jgi:hypothetical protein